MTKLTNYIDHIDATHASTLSIGQKVRNADKNLMCHAEIISFAASKKRNMMGFSNLVVVRITESFNRMYKVGQIIENTPASSWSAI